MNLCCSALFGSVSIAARARCRAARRRSSSVVGISALISGNRKEVHSYYVNRQFLDWPRLTSDAQNAEA